MAACGSLAKRANCAYCGPQKGFGAIVPGCVLAYILDIVFFGLGGNN